MVFHWYSNDIFTGLAVIKICISVSTTTNYRKQERRENCGTYTAGPMGPGNIPHLPEVSNHSVSGSHIVDRIKGSTSSLFFTILLNPPLIVI